VPNQTGTLTGARRVVASTLGYTPDTLPERVAFRLEYDIE
jgi:hypothetical protein